MKATYTNDIFALTDSLIKKRMKALHITGASVSIVEGNDRIYSKGFGSADKASGIPVNENTIFKIGSITKVFTSTAIMQLAEKEMIDIDLPVKYYLKNFSIKSRFDDIQPITIRDLLCHHAGLPCDDLRNYFTSDPDAFKSVVDYLKNTYLVVPPGKYFYYSNLGVNLLGILIEQVSSMPYYQYIENYILKALDMKSSAIILPEDHLKNISKPYHRGKRRMGPSEK